MIRYATANDIEACQRIARQHSAYLPFISRAQLSQSLDKRELFVADSGGAVVGFVRWHARKDGWSTLYDLAVAKEAQGSGIGRALLYAVPCPVRLKCTVDNPANRFYSRAGMTLESVEQGKKRALNIWSMRRLVIFCKGANKRYPDIARKAGMAYGTRNDYKPSAWPFMFDIRWKNYDWDKYLALVRQYRPVMAMVADYERPEQRRQMYQQIRDLKALGVLRIMVCPKFPGAVAHIPSWCVVAISVDSEYAGYEPPPREVTGRKVHLLGGGTDDHLRCIDKYHAANVLSVDGNMFTIWADYGRYWKDGKQKEVPYHLWNKSGSGKNYKLALQSARNIQYEVAHYQARRVSDMPLFLNLHRYEDESEAA